MTDPIRIQQELMCEFPPPDPLHQFVEEYHQRCDEYDARVCTASRNGVPVPGNGQEGYLISSHASSVLTELAHRAGVTPSSMRQAVSAESRRRRWASDQPAIQNISPFVSRESV